MSIQIYHNPKCSKSRETLSLLEQKGCEVEVKLYLQHQFSCEELQTLAQKLSLNTVAEMMRTKDELYQKLGLEQATEQQRLQAIVENSALLERPIVVNGNKAKIARPPESVLEIL